MVAQVGERSTLPCLYYCIDLSVLPCTNLLLSRPHLQLPPSCFPPLPLPSGLLPLGPGLCVHTVAAAHPTTRNAPLPTPHHFTDGHVRRGGECGSGRQVHCTTQYGSISGVVRLQGRQGRPCPPPAQEVVIASVARTPIGTFGGSLATVTAPQLGAHVIKASVERAGISVDSVDEVFMGNVVSAGIGQAPARQAAMAAGLPQSVPCTTINKVCASGMKALMFASASIATGHQGVVVAGGMESMSNIPYYVPKARNGYRYGHGALEDGVLKDGLWDVYNDQHMGMCGEKCADDFGFDRASQDAIAIASYERAIAAAAAGKFDAEIAPIDVKTRKGVVTVAADEEYSRVDFEKMKTLRPAFKKDGTVTAANASPLNDGACALVLMSASRAAELGVKPLARVRGFGDAAQAPEDFTTAPSKAMPIALGHAGLTVGDVDFWECNEAFAVVMQANMQLLGIDHARMNVNGGAVAIGHPIGASGARIVTTLLSVLQQNDGAVGGAMICNGGGGASAIVVERL